MDAENRSVCPPRVSTTGYLFICIRWTRISIPPTPFCRVACVVGKGTNARRECDYSLIIDKYNDRRIIVIQSGIFPFFVAGTKIVCSWIGREWASVSHRPVIFVLDRRLSPPSLQNFERIVTLVEFDFDDLFAAILFFANKMKRKKRKKWKHISATNLIFPAMTYTNFNSPSPPTISLPPIKKDEIIFWSKEFLDTRVQHRSATLFGRYR